VAALVDEDVWTYVGNTGKFHRNEGVRDDYFLTNEAQHADIGIAEAKRRIAEGVGQVDEQKHSTRSRAGARTRTPWTPRSSSPRWSPTSPDAAGIA
jgi:hypothetical protein